MAIVVASSVAVAVALVVAVAVGRARAMAVVVAVAVAWVMAVAVVKGGWRIAVGGRSDNDSSGNAFHFSSLEDTGLGEKGGKLLRATNT